MEIEESFAEMLEKSIKTLNTGDKVTGVVTGITPTEVQVDLGTKHAGYIPVSELTDDPTVKPEDIVKVGDDDRDLSSCASTTWRAWSPCPRSVWTAVKNWDDDRGRCRGQDHRGGYGHRGEQGRRRRERQGHPRLRPRFSDRSCPAAADHVRAGQGSTCSCASPRSTVPAAVWWAPSAPLPREERAAKAAEVWDEHRGRQELRPAS